MRRIAQIHNDTQQVMAIWRGDISLTPPSAPSGKTFVELKPEQPDVIGWYYIHDEFQQDAPNS